MGKNTVNLLPPYFMGPPFQKRNARYAMGKKGKLGKRTGGEQRVELNG